MAAAAELTPERLRRLRAAAQLLHRPARSRDPVEVARASAGIQAQDPHPARLSFRSRSRTVLAADVDRARTEERSLLRTWLMRMTIHIIPTEDAGWMLPLFEPRVEAFSRRRLEQLGMPPATQAKAMRRVSRMLEEEGPLTRPQVIERLADSGIELDRQMRHHIAGVAIASGIAILGPDRGATSCMVLRRDWLGETPPFERERALAELARRYLRAFGPASDRDMAIWSGLGLREVRAGLEAIGSELETVRVAGQELLALGAPARLPRRGQVRLLGAFDTYLLGHRDRTFAAPPERVGAINEGGGGMINAVISRDGEVIGVWRSRRPGGGHEITLEPFEPLDGPTRAAVEAEIADIGRFEGVEPILR